MMEQKPSSRKVSMKVRRKGPQTKHCTALFANLKQHLLERKHIFLSKSEMRSNRAKSSIVMMSNPEF